MHRIDTPTAQKDKFGAGKNGFTAGNPQTGTPATDLDNDYFDMLQEELAGVVEATGISLDKSKHNQLLTAMKALLLSRAHPFADIKADGAAAVAEAIENLGFSTLTTTSYPSRISLLGWKIMFGIATASSTPGAAKVITFPEAFKAEAPVLILSPNNASTAATVAWYDNQTKTGFNLRCNEAVSCTWLAIG